MPIATRVALATLVVALAAIAEMPSPASLREPLYILADHVDGGVHKPGIWSLDLTSRAFSRAAAFPFRTANYPFGRVYLGTLDDRLVVEGSDYYEFDVASGRFLRRYRPLPSQYAGWTFRAFGVNTDSVGLQPGFYGIPTCPVGLDTFCTGFNDPGLSGDPTTERASILLRRPLPPHADFSVFQRLVPPSTEIVNRTLVTLDEVNARVWSFRDTGNTLDARTFHQQLSFFPITSGTLGKETLVRDTTWTVNSRPNTVRGPVDLTYHDASNALFAITEDRNGDKPALVRWNFDGSEESVLTDPNHEWYALTALHDDSGPVTTQVIPAIGHANGVNNTRWRTDLWLFNPSNEVATVTLRRVARPTVSVTGSLAPHASLALTDILAMMGGGDTGDGVTTDALVVTSTPHWGAEVVAAARTWTPGSRGTYGQGEPAVPSHLGYSTHSSVFEPAIDTVASQPVFILDKRDEHQFRHNMGVVNDTDEAIVVRLRYAERTTADVGSPVDASFTVVPHSVGTVNLESLFPTTFAATRPPRLWIAASQPAPIWLSMVDNKTGDGTFIPYSLLALASTESRIVLPAVANTPGANGTFWQSDVYGALVSTQEDLDVGLKTTFEPADGTTARTTRLRGVTGWSMAQNADDPFWISVYPDVVGAFGGTTGALTVDGASWMAGFARTYTRRPDGGTYGEMLPFYPETGYPVQHFAGIRWDADFRANVGLYNALAYDVINDLTIYNADGAVVGHTAMTVPPHNSIQLSFASLLAPGTPPGIFGMSVVPQNPATGPGRSFAYVSVVDNQSGDPTNLW